jgi:predicted lysophospholipase L1 biosynthesis ABC-type transport system permease subunit
VWVSLDFFDVLGAPIVAGRTFRADDIDRGAETVIVNTAFVRDVLDGRSPIGLRIRELPDGSAPALGSWLEIVGIAPDLGVLSGDVAATTMAAFYRPAPPGAVRPAQAIVRGGRDPAAAAARLHATAAAVDPGLRLHHVGRMSDGDPTLWSEFEFLYRLLTLVSVVALVLSLAGIHAAMSFAVAKRAREIGIRVALGADAARVVRATFLRPLVQVATGVALGSVLAGALAFAISGALSAVGAVLVAAYALAMLGVCLLSSVAPVRRALRVDPSEALRAEV